MAIVTAQRLVTIERHIAEQEHLHPHATGEFSRLLRDLLLAIRLIAREVSRAGLTDILGLTGTTNIYGEAVRKLDSYANEVIIRAMEPGGHLCAMASEESAGPIILPPERRGKYILLFDPLDGSTNIDVNVTIGTIFSIYRRRSKTPRASPASKSSCSLGVVKLPLDTSATAAASRWSTALGAAWMSSPTTPRWGSSS